jgi:membrane-associated phospholipid phosphatase
MPTGGLYRGAGAPQASILPIAPIMTTSPATSAPRTWRSRFAALHPKAYLGVHGMLGVAACIVMLWAFSFIADEMTEHSLLVRVDHAIVGWLQVHGTEGGESFFNIVSWFGAQAMIGIMIVVVLVFAVRRDWFRAGAVAIAALGGTLLNTVLKLIFHRGRPEFATEFITHQSWSFPSGHAMNSLVGYGFLAYLLLERTTDLRARIAILLVTTIVVGLVGFSRLYLGVHYLSDVIAGFLAGGIWLLVCITGYRFAKRPSARAAS